MLLALAVGGLTIPVAALVIPQFDQALALGYVDTRIGLIVVYGAFFASWSSLFFYSLLPGPAGRPAGSGRLDGASARVAFTAVALPLALPAVAVGFVLNVFLQWSELLLGLIMLPGGDVTTAMTAIATFSTQFRTGGPLTAAATVIVALPDLPAVHRRPALAEGRDLRRFGQGMRARAVTELLAGNLLDHPLSVPDWELAEASPIRTYGRSMWRPGASASTGAPSPDDRIVHARAVQGVSGPLGPSPGRHPARRRLSQVRQRP